MNTTPGDRFINPYTFVQFPDAEIHRGKPTGHDSAPRDNLSGTIRVTLESRSRVMVRGTNNVGPPDRGGTPIIPGSSFHGALRSFHETLAGGCLRIFDTDFVPSYRDSVSSGLLQNWRLAVVDEVDDQGRPTQLQLCEDTLWVTHDRLHDMGLGELSTGLRINLEPREVNDKNRERKILRKGSAQENPNGDWVLLLSDGSARQVQKVGRNGDRKETRYYVTLGRMSGRKIGGDTDLPAVPKEVWKSFTDRAKDARDFTKALQKLSGAKASKWEQLRQAESPKTSIPGRWPKLPAEIRTPKGDTELVGSRVATRPWLFPGQPIWVRETRGEITDLKVALAWRHRGKTSAGKRVPQWLLPCRDPEELCISCQIFGSADTNAPDEDEHARQRSYRGHVRVGDLIPQDFSPADLETLELAPLSAPRPGSGQFYLAPTKKRARENELPLREWGSPADDPDSRLLRGRKRYWATSDRRTWPRWKRRPGQSDTQSDTVKVFPAGTRFEGTIYFDNLTSVQLGSLLAALQPQSVLGDQPGAKTDDIILSVGGGKPFGFGACRTQVQLEAAHRPLTRWPVTGSPESAEIDESDAIREFLDSGIAPVSTWPQLAATCQFDRVNTNLVWYPPGADWQYVGDKQFDEGFDFWQLTEGTKLGSQDRPLQPLPDPDEPDQRLPIRTKRAAGSASRPAQRRGRR